MNDEYENREQLENAIKEQLIYSMLTENTGEALGDSGDIYGRHWEKNQNKTLQDFQNEPSVTYKISKPQTKSDKTIKLEDIDYKISTFHYLVTNPSFNQDAICQYFNTHFVPAKNWESDKAYGLSKAGEQWLENWGFEFKEVFNSVNGKDFLSQTLQGTFLDLVISHPDFGLHARRYILLQVHQGCDVRAGYTDARLFYLALGGLPGQLVQGYIGGHEVTNLSGALEFTEDDLYMSDQNQSKPDPITITRDDKIQLFLF